MGDREFAAKGCSGGKWAEGSFKIVDAPTDDEPHSRSSTTDVKQTLTHSKPHQPSIANMVVYYSLPAIGKVGSHYVRQSLRRQTLSARS